MNVKAIPVSEYREYREYRDYATLCRDAKPATPQTYTRVVPPWLRFATES